MLLPIPIGVFIVAHLSTAQEPIEGDLSPPELATPQAHEDTRCRCVCPNLSVLLVNITQKVVLPQRQIYVQSGVVPSECRCDQVVSPKILEDPTIASHVKLHQINEKFCPRCVCKSETRNTTVIKIVVIFISFVIGVLSLYMGFLLCLDPWMKRNKQLYHMQTNEEVRRKPARWRVMLCASYWLFYFAFFSHLFPCRSISIASICRVRVAEEIPMKLPELLDLVKSKLCWPFAPILDQFFIELDINSLNGRGQFKSNDEIFMIDEPFWIKYSLLNNTNMNTIKLCDRCFKYTCIFKELGIGFISRFVFKNSV